MMKLNWRKALAATLAAAMTLTAVPGAVFADEISYDTADELVSVQSIDDLADVSGSYENVDDISIDSVADDISDLDVMTADDVKIMEDDNIPEGYSAEDIEKTGDGDAPTDPHAPLSINLDNKPHTGMLTYEHGAHYFMFNVPRPGRVTLKVSSQEGVGINILDDVKNGDDWGNFSAEVKWYQSEVHDKEFAIDLIAGTYYMDIVHYADADYTFWLSFKDVTIPRGGISIIDPVMGGARLEGKDAYEITPNTKYVSMFPQRKTSSCEWFKFQIDKDNTPIYLTLNSPQIGRVQFNIYYDGVGASNIINFKKPYFIVYRGNGYSGEKLITSDVPWQTPRLLETDKFPHGTYYLVIRQNGGVNDTGYYNLEIGTKQKAPVKSVTFNKNQQKIALGKGGTEKLVPVIAPVDADEKSVVWSVNNPLVATVDDEGNVMGKSKGTTTVKATSTVNKDLFASCEVEVVDVVVDNVPKEGCPAKVVKERFDTTTSEFFGTKYDKYEVSNPKIGAVDKNGFFVAKSAGKTEVSGFVMTSGKLFVRVKTCVINIEQPLVNYNEKDTKGRILKYFTVTHPNYKFDAASKITSATCKPDSWEISDKKGISFELETDSEGKQTGKVICKGNGKCLVTAVYGEGKTAARVSFLILAVMPKLNAAKMRVVPGQAFALKLANAKETDEISWEYVASTADDRVIDKSDAGTIEDASPKKTSKLVKRITVNKAVNSTIKVTVNGDVFTCDIDVLSPELNVKGGMITLKVGKAGKVAVKNLKILTNTWVSSDPTKVEIVNSVKGVGVIKAIAAGETTVYTEVAGMKIECPVKVIE